jgi:hypothetical protein
MCERPIRQLARNSTGIDLTMFEYRIIYKKYASVPGHSKPFKKMLGRQVHGEENDAGMPDGFIVAGSECPEF